MNPSVESAPVQSLRKTPSDCRFGVAQRFSAAVSALLSFAALAAQVNFRPAEQLFSASSLVPEVLENQTGFSP
jgi:hypothetical protein